MSATTPVIAAYKEPETAADLSRIIRMLLADQLDIVGNPHGSAMGGVCRDQDGEIIREANGEPMRHEDGEVFEVPLENDREYAVIVAPVGAWYAWRKKIQER